jgi:DNA polymerase III epsilon subunit-like protein
MSKAIVLDCETTGVSKEDQVIELGVLNCETLKDEKLSFTRTVEEYMDILLEETKITRYFPSCPIHPRAFEVHGIGLSELTKSPKSTTVYIEKVDYIVGHNIYFDRRLLLQSNPELADTLENAKYICTLGLSKNVSKYLGIEVPGHNLVDLTDHYFPEHASKLNGPIHRAKEDIVKTMLVLLKICEHFPALDTWEDLYNFQESLKATKKVKK